MTFPLFIPEVTESAIVYKGYFDVRVDTLLSSKGVSMVYTSLETKVNAAVVLAKTKEGKFIINKEYRYPTGTWLLSCPGGRIDPGEEPLEAGIRELREEAGYTGGRATLMREVFSLPAITAQKVYYIFIDGVELTCPIAHEPFELIHTELKTEKELFEEIAEGACVDAILCTALFLAKSIKDLCRQK